MAAIAATHATARAREATDRRQTVARYNQLARGLAVPDRRAQPDVALGHADGPAAGLSALDQLATEPQLASYHHLPAACAEFLHRLGRTDEAATAWSPNRRCHRS